MPSEVDRERFLYSPLIDESFGVNDYFRKISQEIQTLVTELANIDSETQQLFTFAAYGAIDIHTPHPDGNIGVGWQPLDFYNTVRVPARGITLGLNGEFSVDNQGVYMLNLTGSVEHNSSNGGRSFNIRLYNVTDGIAEPGILIGTGRNAEATTIPVSSLFELSPADVGKIFRAEYGGSGDTYSAVVWNALNFSIHNVGEWRDPLPSEN